jgi:hypothetical protein
MTMTWRERFEFVYALTFGSAMGLLCGYGLSAVFLLAITGCDSFRNKVEKQTIRVERRDSSGKPIKIGFVASDKPVKVPVKYETEDGQYNVEIVDINGYDVSPPPLPQETKKP